MAIRTVRLDEEEERVLQQIRRATGLPISEALKRGLRLLHQNLPKETKKTPYEIYCELDLGPGGSAIASSTDSSRAVKEVVRRKLGR